MFVKVTEHIGMIDGSRKSSEGWRKLSVLTLESDCLEVPMAV